MSTNSTYIISILMLVSINAAFAQTDNSSWSVALKSSYFADRPHVFHDHSSHNVTTIKDPLSVGFQLRYFARTNLSLQLASESINGASKTGSGDELNVLTSFSILLYPFKSSYVSTYLIYGINMVQGKNDSRAKTSNDPYMQIGIGSDFKFIGSVFYSAEAKIFSDGWNYLGWGPALSMGYRF